MTHPSPQTELLQKDIEHLSTNVLNMSTVMDRRFDAVATEQLHQWQEIKEGNKEIVDMKLTIKGIASTAAIYSTVGSSVATAIVVYLVMTVLGA
jgi:hypothetical protein